MNLTPRELEALAAYAANGSYKAAAYALSVSEDTLRHHLHNAYEKLDVGTALDAFRALRWLRVPRFRMVGGVDAARQTARGA